MLFRSHARPAQAPDDLRPETWPVRHSRQDPPRPTRRAIRLALAAQRSAGQQAGNGTMACDFKPPADRQSDRQSVLATIFRHRTCQNIRRFRSPLGLCVRAALLGPRSQPRSSVFVPIAPCFCGFFHSLCPATGSFRTGSGNLAIL